MQLVFIYALLIWNALYRFLVERRLNMSPYERALSTWLKKAVVKIPLFDKKVLKTRVLEFKSTEKQF